MGSEMCIRDSDSIRGACCRFCSGSAMLTVSSFFCCCSKPLSFLLSVVMYDTPNRRNDQFINWKIQYRYLNNYSYRLHIWLTRPHCDRSRVCPMYDESNRPASFPIHCSRHHPVKSELLRVHRSYQWIDDRRASYQRRYTTTVLLLLAGTTS